VIGLLALAGSAPAAGASTVSASFGDQGRFPARALLVSAPASQAVTPRSLQVTENGRPVQETSVTPLAAGSHGDFGVVLVIDTSQSMRGTPIQRAMLAARVLARHRTQNEEIGAIEFNSTASDVLPLTSSSALIDTALARAPRIASGTHIYDATLLAIRELSAAHVTAGSVIVLSDGADLGSTVNQRTVAAAAATNGVRIYTVGVGDRSFTPRTLQALARAASGTYTHSATGSLQGVLTAIQSQLSARYLVRYRSDQGQGENVTVAVRVAGLPGAWVGHYRTPAHFPAAAPAPVKAAPAPSFWATRLAAIAISLGCALLLVGGLLLHLTHRARKDDLRLRIAGFTTIVGPDAPPSRRERARLKDLVEVLMGRFVWWPRFKEEVEVGGFTRSGTELFIIMAVASLSLAVLAALVTGVLLLGLPILVLGPVLLSGIVRRRVDAQRRLFVDQLPGHLEEIGSAMRAGHSVIASIGAMAEDAVDPSRREFQQAVADEQLGVPLDAALRPIARRMKCSDIDQLALVATLNQRTGGNMAAVLDLIAAGVRERLDLRRELQALTAQARLSRWVVTALPVGVLAILAVIHPAYLYPVLHTTAGAIVLVLATLLLIAGSFVMRLIIGPQE
jgi:tight adherence protein B